MRRGHQGSGSWRNENPRNFRPRSGSPMHFRTPRNYNNQHELPRFHPSNQRGFVRPPFYQQSNNNDHYKPLDHDERNNYRHSVHHLPPRPTGQRLNIPYMRPMRHTIDKDHQQPYNENFYEDVGYQNVSNKNFQVNRMGDIDFRQPNKNITKQPLLSSWNGRKLDNSTPHEDPARYSYDRPHRRDSCEILKLPSSDYGGHRPHSSDYYGSNPVPDIDNSNSFSQSVDDTVDIIRKRLQNRNDPQYNQQLENEEINQVPTQPEERESSFERNQQEAPRKRIQRQKQNAKVNCDNIKNKIVHQLFKMDKDTIHKLMDNPNSSSKFEYAISSLITESQNSYNRHLRSAAEKSLCQSSTEFIHNDNNTVYEDTFIRQMQCILDPQDTILLEDIKPLVLAELSKVLQLNEFENPMESLDKYSSYNYEEQENCNQYENNDEFHTDVKFTPNLNIETSYDNNYAEPNAEANKVREREMYTNSDDQPTFERPRRQSNADHKNSSSESLNKHHRRSLDDSNERCESVPIFESSTVEQLSDDEDPFAELDNQYHVAVDHNFIEGDYGSPQHTTDNETPNSPILSTRNFTPPPTVKSSSNINYVIKREVDESSLNSSSKIQTLNPIRTNQDHATKYSETVCSTTSTVTSQDQKFVHGSHSTYSENENHVSSSTMKSMNVSSNSRKRSIDQKPAHRKEKRKKSESSQPESNITVVESKSSAAKGECAKNNTSKELFSKDKPVDESTKDPKEVEPSQKEYSDKYVKRKETPKKTKSGEQKKIIYNPAIHTIISTSDKDSNSSSHVSQTSTKSDSKTTLKTFDMFLSQPRKSSATHQPLRNTTPIVVTPKIYIKKAMAVPACETNHITKTTQTTPHKVKARATQTICTKVKNHVKSVQTEPVVFSSPRPISKATDAFERMKEIDMEIQVLLQEKFKLYNSLESKDGMPTSMPSLGMTVVNVEETKDDTARINADEIVEDFTNIPVEELEEIAMESVKPASPLKSNKKTLRNKVVAKERKTSESPTHNKKTKKNKSPNILGTLIEQIITDERPLEEIIDVDALEELTPKTKKKFHSKKKSLKKNLTKQINNADENCKLKSCSVVLLREDLSKYMTTPEKKVHVEILNVALPKPVIEKMEPLPPQVKSKEVMNDSDVEEVIVNDLQIDMLDVSEDIVIGDMCEIKTEDDKNTSADLGTSSEDVIVDNSQPSAAEVSNNEAKQNSEECKIYDYSADENLRRDSVVVSGNGDSVLAIECVDNNFLAACLDGNVYYFSGSGQLLTTLRGSNLAVTCLTVVREKYGTTVYTGSLDSRIRYYDLESGLEKGPECNVLSPIQTMDRAWDTVFVGTRTGFVLQFECKNNMLIPVSTVKFSDQSILALRALKEGPRKVLLVAARSENVTIKDAQTGLLLRTLQGPKMTVYTLLFEDGKVYCGTSSNQIHVFDYASGSHCGTHRGGKGAVCLRACGGLLFAGCYDGCVYVYRDTSRGPLARLRGPDLMLLSLAVHGTKIIAGYKDRSLFIWKIPLAILQEMIL